MNAIRNFQRKLTNHLNLVGIAEQIQKNAEDIFIRIPNRVFDKKYSMKIKKKKKSEKFSIKLPKKLAKAHKTNFQKSCHRKVIAVRYSK